MRLWGVGQLMNLKLSSCKVYTTCELSCIIRYCKMRDFWTDSASPPPPSPDPMFSYLSSNSQYLTKLAVVANRTIFIQGASRFIYYFISFLLFLKFEWSCFIFCFNIYRFLMCIGSVTIVVNILEGPQPRFFKIYVCGSDCLW